MLSKLTASSADRSPRIVYPLILICFFLFGVMRGQPSASELDTLIQDIHALLNENYVFPEVGNSAALFLQEERQAGRFDHLDTPQAIAAALTTALQSVTHDKHLRVGLRPYNGAAMDDPAVARQRQLQESRNRNFGFYRVERLADNVGYLDLREFADPDFAAPLAHSAMRLLANSDAIIIDLRNNGGGSPEMVQLLCSYFFDPGVHLNSLYWRQGDILQEYWTLASLPAPRMPQVPLFVLTSQRTFSAAEEFCYNMQTRQRATVIGEITGGGANPGDSFPVNSRYSIFIPTGRAINPVTGTNWEGTGVRPDVAVAADSALIVARRKALPASSAYRAEKQQAAAHLRDDVPRQLQTVDSLFDTGQRSAAKAALFQMLDDGLAHGYMSQASINSLGYGRLGEIDVQMAIAIFQFVVARFPESPNAYDSLGDAYSAAQKFHLARMNYKTACEKAEKVGDPNIAAYRNNLERVEKKIKEGGG